MHEALHSRIGVRVLLMVITHPSVAPQRSSLTGGWPRSKHWGAVVSVTRTNLSPCPVV